jgi:hypothetical protein
MMFVTGAFTALSGDWETLYRLRLQAEHGTGPGAAA